MVEWTGVDIGEGTRGVSHGGYGPGTGGGDPFGGNPFGGDPFAPPGPTKPSPGPSGGKPTGSVPEVNTLATLAVVFAFVFAPAGAVLGHLGLAQIARTGQRGRDRALIGVTLSYVFIVVAVVAVVVSAVIGDDSAATTRVAETPTTTPVSTSTPPPSTTTSTTPPPPPPPPLVDAAGLPGLLLTVEEARAMSGDTGLGMISDPNTAPTLPSPDESVYEPQDCLPSFLAGATPAYQNSGFTAYYDTAPGNRDTLLQISQAVSTYADPAAAQRALSAYLATWNRCAGTVLSWKMMQERKTAPLNLAAPQDAGGGVSTLRNESGLDRIPYFRAIAAKDNVLVDVLVSGGDQPPALAADVVKRILEKIPG